MAWLAGHQCHSSIIRGEGISCPELSPRPPAAKHGANSSPGAGACRDAHTWSTGCGRGGKLLPAPPEAGADPAVSRNLACGKHLGMAGRAPHGECIPPVSHGSLPHPTCGDHNGSPALGAPTAHPKRPVPAGMGRAPAGAAQLCPGALPPAPLPAARSRRRSRCHRARAGKCPGLFAQEGRGWQAAPVGVADMWDTGMPPSGCQEWGAEGLGEPRDAQKIPILGAELGGSAGTRLIPGANPPQPTQDTSPNTPRPGRGN